MATNDNKRIDNLLAGALYHRYLESKLMYRNNKQKPIKITTKHKHNGILSDRQTIK